MARLMSYLFWYLYIIWNPVGSPHGLPMWLSGKEPACQCRRRGFDPWVRKILWRMKWQPTPVSLPGETLDRGAWCYRPWGRKRVGHDSATKREHQQVVNIHFLNKISVIIASDFSFSVWLHIFSFSMFFFSLLGSNLESFYKFNWIFFKSFPWEFLLDCWAGFNSAFRKPFTWAPHNSYREEIWVGFELRSIFLVAKQRHKCRGNLDFTKRF